MFTNPLKYLLPTTIVATTLFVATTHWVGRRVAEDDLRATTFRTTDLLVDDRSMLGNAVELVNEAFAAPTGSVNNFDPWAGGPHTARLEIDTTAAASPFDVTGIVAGSDGDLLYIWNGGGVNDVGITFTNADPASSALNQFNLPYSGSYTLNYQCGALFVYLGGFGWSLLQGDGGNVMPTQLTLTPTRPTALANGSTTNNYDPWGSGPTTPTIYQDTGTVSTITGIAAPLAGGRSGYSAGTNTNDGVVLNFINVSSTGTITLTCNAAGSLAQNRIACSQSIVLTPFSGVELLYDDNGTGIWRVRSLALSP